MYVASLGSSDFASTSPLPGRTPKLTEDPPFGGLWCDQPALFLPAIFSSTSARVREPADDRHERIEVHGLRYVQIEPRIDCRLDIGARGVAGERNRDHARSIGESA